MNYTKWGENPDMRVVSPTEMAVEAVMVQAAVWADARDRFYNGDPDQEKARWLQVAMSAEHSKLHTAITLVAMTDRFSRENVVVNKDPASVPGDTAEYKLDAWKEGISAHAYKAGRAIEFYVSKLETELDPDETYLGEVLLPFK